MRSTILLSFYFLCFITVTGCQDGMERRGAIFAESRATYAAWRGAPNDEEKIEAVRSRLGSEDEWTRYTACRVLYEEDGDKSLFVADLIGALECGHGVIEGEAARALGSIGADASAAVPQLTRKVSQAISQRSEGSLSWYAAEALGEIGGEAKAAVPVLERAASSDLEDLARISKASLAKIEGCDQ